MPDVQHYDLPSDSGGQRAPAIFTLIETCKLNGVDAERWLADILARIAEPPRQTHQRTAAVELESGARAGRQDGGGSVTCGAGRMLTMRKLPVDFSRNRTRERTEQ